MTGRTTTSRSELARLGFAELSESLERIADLRERFGADVPLPVDGGGALWGVTADPDGALRSLERLLERAPDALRPVLADEAATERLVRLLGASVGLGEFLHRRPAELDLLLEPVREPWSQERYTESLVRAVDGTTGEDARVRLRVRYRRHLAQIALYDVLHAAPTEAFPSVAAGLADLAGAALEAAVQVARREVPFPADDVAATPLAVIAMGKAGARELNYVSDVDVIFVTEATDAVPTDRAVLVSTRIAIAATHAITDLAAEPALWEVDANLRPEGKDGALVRTLDSHVAYYERWAKGWEFQALLKARPIAGSADLGRRYAEAVAPFVWSSSGRPGFVESVQRMRERVTEHIPDADVDRQLKLGPGGLRDVEFTVQLLQLVHGRDDPSVRVRSTLEAMDALTDAGYVGRAEAARFGPDYALLRVLEHRIQLRRLQRTHLMPTDEEELRVLARSSGVATSAAALETRWRAVKLEVRGLHERLFYRPLLSAVAAADGVALTNDQVVDRLGAIGFVDPAGAIRHIRALTQGTSRRAAIQRNLLPVLLRWMAEGPAPDRALLAFRRLSDTLGESSWFLRMLRDSSGAAHSLTTVLSESAFLAGLLERFPEAVAWLDEPESLLRPRPIESLLAEMTATTARHGNDVDGSAALLRSARRRETLRLGMAAVLGHLDVDGLGPALSDVTEATLAGALALARRDAPEGLEFGIIAMGRFGGRELGFGSDADVLYVHRAPDLAPEVASRAAQAIVRELNRLTEDTIHPLDLDIDLRPEGKNGPVVRTLESYGAYYARWSLTWEAQALLRARGAVGDEQLLRDFEHLADRTRYPDHIDDNEVREVRRIKARVESERLPRGADPARHLKLGRGSLSDVEWFVQLLQLQHALEVPALRTTSTLEALHGAVAAGFVAAEDGERLGAAWRFASRTRSALVLWSGKTTDVLPVDRVQLEGVARLLEYPPGSASELEEDYLGVTRRARQVFEREFYGA
ncbi:MULTISPECIES: bifunctional [glutamine synthetase] adenylyltransferase/[glutamine synthetase]-adenylyl-L-tyrosine phosphorylase [unclassified Curtobacterium]|uniref:bifunctional [glutamine synthetase] adenylyltransferase/[glutamine synthetase]-adenylyl-L-tyrosine phosphorylase n=1 Tax=unclassified Curtobacterium TaxID=257496 RepID=UPI0008DE2D0E|nr:MULTISPECIES: bifunctional [glutamine synthetase] adenylyltransferase/[glutamine synthetase]-adenylyl-L-tyrosine phosphorylase [unclassified Curtobacterium]OIH98489.1 bifunctional glutamine-synthetase adenylyltransferase/deadenyltransferase [Curtobacterium sp. MCBA15_003]OII12842.1 bifunctional glutamine-synthetase adenylyltransferase/deadenyltransferase [Curtobacterium sp. MCBA15_009]OII32214.1 bifunctional glutamine-synthetase adenylyltransferase/deadenyltransferase [Curtobacterium sp. MMLR